MPLVNPLQLLQKAREMNIALPAFNIHNMETAKAVVEAAAELKSPVIVATTPGTLRYAGVSCIAGIVRALSELHDIPVALHLDHCSSYETIIAAIRNGYTSVMIDGSHLSYEENVNLVKDVVRVAHSVDISVEAELGRIAGTEDELNIDDSKASLTVPEEARQFIDDTGIDTLAIAIGTAHGVYKGEPEIDYNRLSEIYELVDIPLVLHGASGIPDTGLKRAIDSGISKVNIATELKIALADAIKKYFKENPDADDPRYYLGVGQEAVKEVVKDKIELCGSKNLL